MHYDGFGGSARKARCGWCVNEQVHRFAGAIDECVRSGVEKLAWLALEAKVLLLSSTAASPACVGTPTADFSSGKSSAS
jgi:hypothetical protein